MALSSKYEFQLPRGYVDRDGELHRDGVMRLATARDELEPLRDPRVSGPDDPQLTILVLARVVEQLGTLSQVTSHEIEGLFAADLAYLQDFYGVINFGNQEEYEELLRVQEEAPPPPVPIGVRAFRASAAAAVAEPAAVPVEVPAGDEAASSAPEPAERPSRRSAILEIPANGR